MRGRAAWARWALSCLLALAVAAPPAQARTARQEPSSPTGPTAPGPPPARVGADLAIEDEGLHTVYVISGDHPQLDGTITPFRATVTNRGPADAVDVLVTLSVIDNGPGLNPELRLAPEVSNARPSQGDCTFPGGNVLRCHTVALASGATLTVDFERLLTRNGAYWTSVASVSAQSSDPILQNNEIRLNTSAVLCGAEDCALIDLFCILLRIIPSRGASQAAAFALDLPLFYRLREEVVRHGPAGQRYVALYEAHSPEIGRLLAADRALRDDMAAGLAAWQPTLQALVDGQGAGALVTAEQVAAIERVLDRLAASGSPALRQAIADERARRPLARFAGLTVEQARSIQVGHRTYLPVGAQAAHP